MASLKQIRGALADTLEGTFEGQISQYMLSNPTLPSAHVYPDEDEPHQTFGRPGTETWNLIVEAFVGTVSDIGAQDTLDDYLASSGPKSLLEAIEGPGPGPQTLDGLVSSVTVTRISGYRQYQLGGIQGLALGCQWTVEVFV